MTTKRFFSIACAASLALLFSAISSPASILLSSRNFTLLGGTAITSTGVAGTVIRNGDVGLWPGATSGITGFTPAVIQNGAIIATGPATRQARLDLMKARVGLAGMPSDKILSNVDLGGKTLRPGVYTFSGAARLTGALVLDARGRNGAFWVFQIGTSLTTAVNSSVTVINLGSKGGRDCGIFWNAGSAITIGANNRTTHNAKTLISGKATVTAADIQWRVNGGVWHTAGVHYEGKWNFGVKAGLLRYGSNVIQLRARDSHGHRTAIKMIFINRLR